MEERERRDAFAPSFLLFREQHFIPVSKWDTARPGQGHPSLQAVDSAVFLFAADGQSGASDWREGADAALKNLAALPAVRFAIEILTTFAMAVLSSSLMVQTSP